jgi:hypothetical protein
LLDGIIKISRANHTDDWTEISSCAIRIVAFT